MLGFFGGSPRAMMAQLVEAGHLTLEDLREGEETLARLEAEKGAAGAKVDESAADKNAPKSSGGTAPKKSGERRGRR
jgi:hypothetical protein